MRLGEEGEDAERGDMKRRNADSKFPNSTKGDKDHAKGGNNFC